MAEVALIKRHRLLSEKEGFEMRIWGAVAEDEVCAGCSGTGRKGEGPHIDEGASFVWMEGGGWIHEVGEGVGVVRSSGEVDDESKKNVVFSSYKRAICNSCIGCKQDMRNAAAANAAALLLLLH